MSIIAEFTVDHVNVALERVFEDYPDATIELDRVVPTDETFVPYFWVWDADVTAVVDLVRESDPPAAVELVDDVEGGGLFRAWWNRDVGGLLEAMEESDLTLRKAVGSAADWLFELRAERTEDLSGFQRYLAENDLDATLVRLYDLGGESATGRFNLTPEQREALLLAYDRGYYEQPTETDLESLAAELGISRSAFGGRLRRAYRNLIESTIAHEQGPGDA